QDKRALLLFSQTSIMQSSQDDFGPVDARNYQPMKHETSADSRHCTCEQLWQANVSESKAWRHPLRFSLGFYSRLFRNSGLYMYFSYCCKYGGLSFSVAYFTVMAAFGLPTVILLAAVGQHSRFGPLRCWSFNPAIRGLGLSILLVSVLHTALNMVVASEGVYTAIVLLESLGLLSVGERSNSSNSPLLSGFFVKRIYKNLNLSDCQQLGLNEVHLDWGICGEIDANRQRHSSEKGLKNHYLWKRVGIVDAEKAAENFAGPKLITTDLLTGRMRRGFRVDSSMGEPVHWTLLTFVFTLTYCCLLLTLMVEPKTLSSWLHFLSVASTASLGVVCIITVCHGDGSSFFVGLMEFVSSSKGLSVTNNLSIWVDATMLVMWNTGCSTGELINLAKTNAFGYNFIGTSLVSLSLHCLANSLHVLCQEIIQAGVSSKESDVAMLLKPEAFGYSHILMQIQPYVLSTINSGLSVAPLLCFAVGEVCDCVSFLCCCVDSLVDVWPRLKNWTGVLHLLLFCLLIALCLPLCFQYGGAAIYTFLYSSWGWNCALLLTMQLAALWSFLGPAGATVLFKHLGLNERLSRLAFWWRLCWFFYTPLLLLLSLVVLVTDSVKFALPSWTGNPLSPVMTGPLQNLSESQLHRSLAEWWLIELIRGLTVLPVPLLAVWHCLSASNEQPAKERKNADPSKPKPKPTKRRLDPVWKEIAAELSPSEKAAKQS
ncbi:hypothetical protein BOX15_Mlig004806g1, partial [Macrostomum lignano]